MPEVLLCESLIRNIGRTVTIFTTSGGISGAGFTGVLAAVTDTCIKLITDIGAAPACPIGSTCTNTIGNCSGYGFNGFGFNGCGCGYGTNWLGSVTEIPIDKIASFTHNAI